MLQQDHLFKHALQVISDVWSIYQRTTGVVLKIINQCIEHRIKVIASHSSSRVLEVCWDLVVLQDPLDLLYVPSPLPSIPLISLPVIDMRYILIFSDLSFCRVLLELTGLQVPKETWYEHNLFSVKFHGVAWAVHDCFYRFALSTGWTHFLVSPQSQRATASYLNFYFALMFNNHIQIHHLRGRSLNVYTGSCLSRPQ